MQQHCFGRPNRFVDVIKTSVKHFLLLSFLLACMPGQNAQLQDVAKTKTFVVVADHVQSLAAAECVQKADKDTEDPHPPIFCDLVLSAAPAELIPHFSSAIRAVAAAYYPIRAPPSYA